jgi:hypothetical protein
MSGRDAVGTPGGQSDEAITGRKLRAIPDAPGCPARYEPAGTIKKIGKTDPRTTGWVLRGGQFSAVVDSPLDVVIIWALATYRREAL